MSSLPGSLAGFGPATLAALIVAVYLVAGEPVVGAVLHRRFEGRLETDPRARRSFYVRLLVLEWGLALLTLLVWASAPGIAAAQAGLALPRHWPGPVTGAVVLAVALFVFLTTRALRMGALVRAGEAVRRGALGGPEGARHAEPSVHSTLALLPRSPRERWLFTAVGVTAGVCEEWLYRGFFLAVVSALLGRPPMLVLVLVAAAAFGIAHAYQGLSGVLLTAVLGGVLAALYLDTGSLLLPVALHALIDLRFLLVPPSALPASSRLAA